MSAKSNVPWSVKGIDQDARSVAKELARRRGMTLGEFITEMIHEKGIGVAQPAPTPSEATVVSGVTTEQLRGVVDTLNRLNDRLKAAESHLALNQLQSKETAQGLNAGLETVFERVKRLESEARGEGSPEISARLERLEGAAEKNSWVKSLVALEKALTTLVEQVETSRDDHDQRLSHNEDLITALQEKLEGEDSAMREELSGLLEAIDTTTNHLTETDAKVQEALSAAREAAESRDETFIERTSQRLQLLGSEIKRTSDQIRGLESQVSRLSEKIEAGEERSAEGISRVALSLDTLRREVEERSLAHGEDAPTERVRSAVQEVEERVQRLQGDFAAVVDQLEGRTQLVQPEPAPAPIPTPEPAAPAVEAEPEPYPQDALAEDFAPTTNTPVRDAFDRAFEDPLGLDRNSTQALHRAEPAPVTAPVPPAVSFDPFAQNDVVNETPSFTQAPPAQPKPEPEPQPTFRAPEPPAAPIQRQEPSFSAFDRGADDLSPEWQAPASQSNPFSEEDAGFRGLERDPLFQDDRGNLIERAARAIRRSVSAPQDNNPALGWGVIIVALAAISVTVWRLSQPGPPEPMVMEPLSAPAETTVAATPPTATTTADPDALYLEAKTVLATAVMPEEMRRAVDSMRRAAEAGSALAQYEMGDLYLNGDGVERNSLRARAWFEDAAQAGHVQAYHRLGLLDVNSIGGASNPVGALDHFTRAANAGFVDSMVNLGTLYDPTNTYLPQDMTDAVEAYFWYRLAAARGDRDGANRAEALAPQLTDGDVARAETRLANWREQNL